MTTVLTMDTRALQVAPILTKDARALQVMLLYSKDSHTYWQFRSA